MKTLVVYYSFEGDSKLIGDAIAEELDADVVELKTEVQVKNKEYMKTYLGEKQVLMKTTPKLMPYDLKPENYDLIIIGTPIWSGTYAPAIRTFLETENIKNKLIGLFYCFTVKRGRILRHFKKALKGNKIVTDIGFKDPIKQDKEEVISRVKNWVVKLQSCIDDD